MAAEADIPEFPDPIPPLKREVEDREMTSELPNTIVSEGPKEERKKIESWLSQPPEIIGFFEKTEAEEVGKDDDVANTNIINTGSVETIESDVFSDSLSVADEKLVRFTEHSQMTSGGEKSDTLADSVGMETDPETQRPTIDMVDVKNKHSSSLLDAPVEETTSEKAGTVVGECVEETMSMSSKEASQEKVELAEEIKDSTSVGNELPHKSQESSFFKKIEEIFFHKVDNLETSSKESESGMKDFVKESHHEAGYENELLENIAPAMSMSHNEASQEKVELSEEIKDSTSVGNELPHKSQESSFFKTIEEVFFHKVDNLETSSKESESGMKDFVKESHHEAGHCNELLENITAADIDQSTAGMHDEIQDMKDDILFGRQRESTVREEKDHIPADNIVTEEQSGQCHMQKTEQEAPMDFEEIETEGSSKYAEMVTNSEEQRPVGIPEEIVGENSKDETVDIDSNNATEVQEANNLPTVDLNEKTRSAELEIPNKSGSELWITHPPVKEEVQVESKNQDDVSMSESGDPPEAIQLPHKEEKHVNEASEATERPKSTVSEPTATEGELNVEETSTSEIDSNMEKGCELKFNEALKDINAEDNVEESEQRENAFDAEFFVERKGDDNGKSKIEEDIPVNKGAPLCLEGEEHHHDQEEKVRSVPLDGGDHSYITHDEINSTDEQIVYQEVCEDSKTADRSEDREKVMHNEEDPVTDFSPEPMGECTTKGPEGNEMDAKHKAEASEGYDTYGESMILEESSIIDIPSPDVREEKLEESLKEDRRDTMISDKEVRESIECRERDSEATHSKEESTVKDLKDEAEASEGSTAQSIMGSSEQETAQESNSNIVQSSSMPDVIEKEVKTELLEKEDPKDAVEAEETQLTESESEYLMRVDSSNLIPEDKGQVKTETSKMRSNGIDIIAESAEISSLGDNEDTNIPTERKDGAVEAAEKTQPESKTETSDELSTKDQREISTVEAYSKCVPEQEHLESLTKPLVAHNLLTGVSETTGEVLERERALSDKEETPIAAETTGEYTAETEGDSTVQENETNMGSKDIGRKSPIDDALVQELHAPLELDYGKSIPESDVELLKGVDTGEAANANNMSEWETSNDEKSSHVGVEPDKSEYEEAVHEASQGVEMGGGCIETENNIIAQENYAKNNEGSSKEGVEIEKATGELESEADGCGSFASETQSISTQTEKKVKMEDRELAAELPNVTVNEVPRQEKENTESWFSQPPESIEIPEAESVQVAHNDELGNVDAVDNVGTTKGESFPKSTLAVDGELNEYSEDDRLNNNEETSGFQEEEEEAKMVTDKYGMAEASDGQDEGVRIQTPELIEGSSRDVEMLNEVPHEEIMESITSTETTSIEQDLKEPSFDREDEKSNTLEMDAEAMQPSTDIGEGKNKGEEMPRHGVKDGGISTETATESEIDEPTESTVGATDKLGSSLVTKPDVCKNLDDSSMACEDEIQETGKLVERVKEDASIEDEAEKQNLESSFVERAENVETSREESETGMKDIDKEMQKEAENQDKTLENATTADIDPSTEGEDVENQERKSYVADMKPDDSMLRESEDIAPAEAMTMECESRAVVAPGEDKVAVEEQEGTETSKHEEHSDEILNQNSEPAKANLGSPSVIASEVFETTFPNDNIESITKIEEEGPVGSQEEILEETTIAAESNEDGTTEAKKVEMEDRELATDLPNVTVNEVPRQEKENTESWLSQPPESIEIPEVESVQVAHDDELGNVDAVDNVGTTKGESFPKSTSAVDGELNEYSEDDRLNNKEETSGFQEEEGKAKMVTGKYGMAEASDGQDEGVRIQTPELIGGSSRDVEMLNEVPHEEITETIKSTETTSIEQDLKETSFDREDEKLKTLVMDAEATQPSTDIGEGKNKGEEMPRHGVKDDGMSTETATESEIDEPTESTVGATDKLGSSLVTKPDVCKNLDDSGMACEDEIQETSKLVERVKEDASIEDEAEKQNLESSFVERAENVETSRGESETGMKDIDKEMQKEAENQDKNLENATTADIDPSTEGEDVENQERKSYVAAMKPDDSMTRESEDIAPAEAMTMECESRAVVAPGEVKVAVEEREATETSKHEEHSEQILNQNTEPAKANLGSPSVIASEVFETPFPNDNIESITKIEEEGPVGSQEEILEETTLAAKSNEDGTTEAKNISMNDAGEKTRSAEFNIPNNDVNEVYVTPRPVEEPEEDEKSRTEVSMLESEEQDKNETEIAKENLGSHLIVALEELTTSHDEYAESITNIEEERPVGNPEEIVGEQRSDEVMIADDSNMEEIPDAESLSAIDSDEKARSEEIKIPDNNTREVCVSHPPMEETVMEGDGKQNEVSFSESVDQVHEASASEFPEDGEKDASDSYEASKSTDCNISEPRCYEGEVNTVVTTSAKEIPGRSEEEILWQPRNDENMISQIPETENPSTVDSYVTPTSMEETFLEVGENKNDVSMSESRNQVREASEFPGEEEKESDDRYEATKSPGSNILEDSPTEGALNMEATSTRSDVDTILDKGCEVISADELKELKAEEKLGEDIKQKEKAVDSEFQMPKKSGDKENSTIKGESLVKNNDPTCTGEGEYHRDQEDEVMSNRSKETSPSLDSVEHSCSTSNEINIMDEEIRNEETVQVHEEPQIVDSGEDREDLMKDAAHAAADVSTEPTGEHATKCPQENETEDLQILPTAEVSANIGMQMKEEDCTTKDDFVECYGEEAQKKCTYDEETKEREPDTVASNIHGSAPLSTTAAECPISDPPSSFTGEEKVEERLKEDRGDEEKSEMELSSSHVECIEAVHSTEEREVMASKQEAEANEEFNGQSITEPSLVETTQKERNVDFGENSSSMPEICEREIKEVLGTEDSSVPMVAEESRLTLVEGQNINGLESADLVFEEKAQVPTETNKMGSNATDLIARTVKNSISGEDNNVEIPTAREAATVESFKTPLDNISEPMLRAPSTPTLEEQNIVSPEVGETTGEAPEKEKKTEKEETSLAEETTEDENREQGYESTNPIEGTNLGSIDEQTKRENDYAAVKDQEFYIPPEQNIEESKSESDVELLRRVNTSEVANPIGISQSETVEELKSSEKDNSEYDTAITEASEGVETCVESRDTEKSILQEDDSAKKLEGSAEESDEIEKAPVQFEAEMQGSETSKAKSISTPKEENINIVEHDETAVEFPEMNPTNTEEQRHDDGNQTITSTDEKVNRQDIQEGKWETNERMETKLENQEETNGTQDAILTEKVSTGIEHASEHETFKEKNTEEESCTKELHILPAADGTFNEVPTVISTSSESEIIKEQIMEEESCTKELHKITAADDTVDDVRETDLTPIQSHEATASDKNAEMMGSNNIAEDLHMESEATQKEVNEPQDAFSTEEVSTETSSNMDEVTYPDLTAIHSIEATSSNKITELMESKTAQDLKESEASPVAEVLEDETKKIEKHVDVSSLISEGSEEKIKGEKIEETEKFDDETDITQVVVTDLSSLGQVQLNEEPVKPLDTSSDAESQRTSKIDDVGEQELEETSIIESQFPIHEQENANNAHIHVEKSDAKDLEVEATTIPDLVSLSEDQAVKEIHETGSSLNVIEHDKKEIEKQTREVTEVSLEPTDAARDDEITPAQIPQPEKTGEQLQVPSSGLLSDEQESETTIGMGSTTKDAVEEAKMRQSEVRMIGAELETTSEGESIENQVQGEENRVQNMSMVSSAQEMDAESSKDNFIMTKMSAEEVNQMEKSKVKDRKVLESKHGGQDTDEPLKALVISSDTGSLQTTDISDARQQELDETSSVVSQFPVDEREKSENIRANVDKSDTYDVEEKELEIPGAVPKPTDQHAQDIQETGTSLPVGEVHTTEIAHQAREVPEAFSRAINQGVEAVSGDEIIAPVATREITSLEELQLKQYPEALDTHSIAENPDAIKTVGVSQQDAVFENMKLEETCSMVSHPPIYVHEEEDRENVAPEKSQANYVEVEETEIPETVPKSEDRADKEIHEIGTSLNVGDSGTNEIEKPNSEIPEALSYAMNQGVDIARNDEITSSHILQDEKLEDQLEAPSSGLLSEEQENETTTTDKKGIADRDDIEGTKILQDEIREELETTGAGKGIGSQDQAEEKRAQDWSTVSSPEELDSKSSRENAMITKMSTEEVLEPDHGGHDTDEHVKALDTSSDTGRLQTTQTPDASQQELEETSSMVSQLPVHTYEKADNESITEEKSVGCDAEVKEINLPSVVPDSNYQRTQTIQEVGTSVKETRTKEMETQIREVCDALPEDVNQARETVSADEITSPSEAIEVTSLGEHQLKDEHVDAPDTNKTGDASEQDAEFDSMKQEETSSLVSQLPINEHEKEESANITVEKTDANDAEVEEADIPDKAPESDEQVVKEIHETGTRLAAGGADTNAIEKQNRGVPEALSEPINPCFDTSNEMTPVKNLQDEKTEEELQVTTSALLSKKEDGETLTAIQKGSTDKDGTQVGSLELQENSGSVFQLPVTEFNSANNEIEEKSDADIVELNETKAMDAVSDSKDRFFEVAEDTEIDKVDDEIKEVTEKIPDLRYMGVDAATGGENLEHDIPLSKLEEQIQLSSSSYESTKEEAVELDKSELEKTTDSSELPTGYGIHHVGTTMEKSEADEVLVEEDKTSKAISESKGDDFYEVKEIGPSPPVEKIRMDEVQEETKAVPETIFEPTYQGAQTAIHVETAINQTLTTLGAEQLHEPESTTQKACSQDERQRELVVSNLELKLEKGRQNISPDEENTGLEQRPTDAPSKYEERPIQQSSQEASTDEDIVYSNNSNKDADNLPTMYPTVTEHSTEDIGGKYEEVSNLEFEKNEEVLLESMSAINSPAVPLTSEVIKVIEETPKENKTEVGTGGNHCEETNQEEAIEKYTPPEKISEEMQGSRNFDKISLQEEMATKANQEDELSSEDYPGERTGTIFDASRNEIPHERMFKESEEECVDKNMEGMVRAEDNSPQQVSASDGIANQLELGSHGDETDFTGTATQLKSSESMLVSQEVERTGVDDEETKISRDGQLQNTDLVVPPAADAAPEEALSEHDLDPNLGNLEPYEHKGEISTAGTINSESLMDNRKQGHTFLEPGCEGSGGTEDFDLTKKDGSNKPSISSTTATSQETLADEGCEKAVDTNRHHFMSDEPTAEPESVPEEGNGFQLEAHKMDKEPAELPVMTDVAKLDENKIRTITTTEGMECGEENRMGKQSEEITEESQMIESAKMSLSDLIQRSRKQKTQVVEDVTQGRELMGNKEEPQNKTAETIEAEEEEEEEEAGHDKKDEGEEGDEQKREDSGSDAPVMVEASRDMDVKIAHKKPHHHNILSGVGSKVKHSLAKVKKAITGKSSHPKPTSPK